MSSLLTNWGLRGCGKEYCRTVELGIPAVLCFGFWNPIKPTPVTIRTSTGEAITITFYLWGDPITSTDTLCKKDPKIPQEEWDTGWGIGHAVTGVGYLRGDPDGRGSLPEDLWLVVHDNRSTTAEDMAVPLDNLVTLIKFLPN